jgi:hypothetical protein
MLPNVQKCPGNFQLRENAWANSGMEFPAPVSRISHLVQTRPVVIRREVHAFPEIREELVQ